MLPKFWLTQYQLLHEQGINLKNQLNSETIQDDLVKKYFEILKKHFYESILPLSPESLALEDLQLWQPKQTELHRTLRLLETDMVFWQASRHPLTRQSRLQILSDRLETFIGYTQSLIHNSLSSPNP